MLSINEAAEFCGVSHWTIRNWVKSGKLNGVRVGPRVLRIPESQLYRVVSRIERQAPRVKASKRRYSTQVHIPEQPIVDGFRRSDSDETAIDRPLSINEAAELCGVTHWTIRKWLKSGKLDGVRVGPRILRIPESQLYRVVRRLKPATSSAEWHRPKRMIIDGFRRRRSDKTRIDGMLSVKEAAEHCRVAHGTIRKWLKSGTLNGVRVGTRTVRIPQSELLRFLSLMAPKNASY